MKENFDNVLAMIEAVDSLVRIYNGLVDRRKTLERFYEHGCSCELCSHWSKIINEYKQQELAYKASIVEIHERFKKRNVYVAK